MSLDEYMTKYNITFNEFCKSVDSNLKVIWRWRNGDIPISLVTAYNIVEATNGEVTLKDLAESGLKSKKFKAHENSN
jgi:hypothetical protein